MTITFSNFYKDNILDGLKKIITSEFNKMPIYNDYPFINRGGTIFVNIQITDDVDEENYTLGTLRKISVTIRLYHRLEGMQEQYCRLCLF